MNLGMTLVLVDYLLDFAEEKGTRGMNREGLLELGTCSRGNCDVAKLVLARGASSLCVDFGTVDLL